MHAPQSPVPQPYFVPVSLSPSRSTHSKGVCGGASVQADLVAQSIVVSGEVAGNVLASVKVDLRATGSVKGDIATPLLLMADGAVVTGKVDVAGRKKP